MPVLRLTDLTVQSLKPGLYYDDRTPGFGLRVGAHRRTWLVVRGKARTQTTLGHYPALSLADARKKALVALGSPVELKNTITFPEAKEAFLAQDRWRPQSKRVLTSNLKHFSWTRPLAKITHEDLAIALDVVEGTSARAHALKDIRTFFNWCVPRYLPASPCVGLKMEKQASRARILTDDELAKVWRAAEQIGYPFGTIVMLLILTGQRRSEIGSLKWDYVKSDRITLPREATKNDREHSFPNEKLASTLLQDCPNDGSGFLFAARGSTTKSFSGWSARHASLLKLSGTSGWTLHDLRRTFATKLAALGVPIHVTEKLLNHVSGSLSGVAGIYNRHEYQDEMRDAMERYTAHLLKLFAS